MLRLRYFLPLTIFLALIAGVFGFLYSGKIMAEPDSETQMPLLSPKSTEFLPHPSTVGDKGYFEAYFNDPKGEKFDGKKAVSAVLPHHLLAGNYIANLFNSLHDADPDVVVIVGPNHTLNGISRILSGTRGWDTPYGEAEVADDIVGKLVSAEAISLDDGALDGETSVTAIMPFVKRAWPTAKVVPIIMKPTSDPEQIKKLAETLVKELPRKSLVLASVDFSHYLPVNIANYHDVLSEQILWTGDEARLVRAEVDSQPSLRLLLNYNKLKESQSFNPVFRTNSAGITGSKNLVETTSHISGFFTYGAPRITDSSEKTITIQFFGDMMLERSVAKMMGAEKLDYVFKDIAKEKRLFFGQDLTVANLEGPFAPARVPTTKSIAFRFDPELVSDLKKYYFSAFGLANNHAYDMGSANASYTRQLLTESGFGFFGDQYKEGAEYTWTTEIGGNKLAFIGLNNTDHPLNLTRVEDALKKAKETSNMVFVSIHWGNEYTQTSIRSQRELAHWLVDHGATAVIGHHPHVVEEIEIYKDVPIYYSLGNFVFDQYFSQETQEGYSVGLVLSGKQVKGFYIFPLYGEKSKVHLMTGERFDNFVTWMNKNSRLNSNSSIEDGYYEMFKPQSGN